MYLDTVVKIPDVQGKITCRSKKGTTYVEYEYAREYLPERKYTIPKRKTIGKQSGADNTLMYPNRYSCETCTPTGANICDNLIGPAMPFDSALRIAMHCANSADPVSTTGMNST